MGQRTLDFQSSVGGVGEGLRGTCRRLLSEAGSTLALPQLTETSATCDLI